LPCNEILVNFNHTFSCKETSIFGSNEIEIFYSLYLTSLPLPRRRERIFLLVFFFYGSQHLHSNRIEFNRLHLKLLSQTRRRRNIFIESFFRYFLCPLFAHQRSLNSRSAVFLVMACDHSLFSQMAATTKNSAFLWSSSLLCCILLLAHVITLLS
jgi:hypothetical protein